MKNISVQIINNTNENRFELHLIHKTNDIQLYPFVFANNSGSLERTRLDFIDQDEKVVVPTGYTMINPASSDKKEFNITKDKPFTYKVIGELIDLGDRVHLKLRTIEYLFSKGEKYFVQLRYSGKKSEKVEIIFE